MVAITLEIHRPCPYFDAIAHSSICTDDIQVNLNVEVASVLIDVAHPAPSSPCFARAVDAGARGHMQARQYVQIALWKVVDWDLVLECHRPCTRRDRHRQPGLRRRLRCGPLRSATLP